MTTSYIHLYELPEHNIHQRPAGSVHPRLPHRLKPRPSSLPSISPKHNVPSPTDLQRSSLKDAGRGEMRNWLLRRVPEPAGEGDGGHQLSSSEVDASSQVDSGESGESGSSGEEHPSRLMPGGSLRIHAEGGVEGGVICCADPRHTFRFAVCSSRKASLVKSEKALIAGERCISLDDADAEHWWGGTRAAEGKNSTEGRSAGGDVSEGDRGKGGYVDESGELGV